MDFNNYELSLLLLLVEGKIKELNFTRCDLDFNKDYMDYLEYKRLRIMNETVLSSTQLLKSKIEKKMLEE